MSALLHNFHLELGQERQEWDLAWRRGTYSVVDAIADVLKAEPSIEGLNLAQVAKHQRTQSNWGISLLWVVQKELTLWTAQESLFNHPEVKACEPWGTLDFLELEIAKWLHNNLPRGTFPYKNPFEHWREVRLEDYRLSFQWVTTPPPPTVELRRGTESVMAALKERQNPCDPIVEPLLWNLLEAARSVITSPDKSSPVASLRRLWWDYRGAFAVFSDMYRATGEYRFARTVVKGDRLVAVGAHGKEIVLFPEKKEVKPVGKKSGRGRKKSK